MKLMKRARLPLELEKLEILLLEMLKLLIKMLLKPKLLLLEELLLEPPPLQLKLIQSRNSALLLINGSVS